jgi:hypothetical protein
MVIVPVYRFTQNDYSDAPAIALIGLLFFIFFLVFIIMSLMGIFQIRYNEGTGQITFYRLYKSHTISVSDIAGYYQSTLKTKWKNYPGYFLVLKDGEIIELNEYNVKPLRDFYAFIVQSGVPCKGTKNSWYPLKRRLRTT